LEETQKTEANITPFEALKLAQAKITSAMASIRIAEQSDTGAQEKTLQRNVVISSLKYAVPILESVSKYYLKKKTAAAGTRDVMTSVRYFENIEKNPYIAERRAGEDRRRGERRTKRRLTNMELIGILAGVASAIFVMILILIMVCIP